MGHKLKLMWLKANGETVVVDSQRQLHAWLDEKWCTHPAILHVLDEALATSKALDLADQASRCVDKGAPEPPETSYRARPCTVTGPEAEGCPCRAACACWA